MRQTILKQLPLALGLLLLVATGQVHSSSTAREVKFTKTKLDAEFRAEGAAVADVNRDGKPDVIAGNFWYEAPAWKPHQLLAEKKFDAAKGYSNCFVNFAVDVNGDGWPDVIRVDMPGTHLVVWHENPKAQGLKDGVEWPQHTVFRNACNESPTMMPITGAGNSPRLVFAFDDTQMAWFEPNKDPNAEFTAHPISQKFSKEQAKDGGVFRYSHGLGVGDINGDGLQDVLIRSGYWQAPADPRQLDWKFVPVNFGEDCAQMLVYDVNGDGRNDVITSSAHRIGVWWHEQQAGGKFVAHEIDNSFSQSHSMVLADINGDGLMDFVTGKRFWAHGPQGDINASDPAVIYWFELQRTGKEVKWVRHEIDNDSGVGTQFTVADLNGDRRPDVITSNKKGVQVFIQQK